MRADTLREWIRQIPFRAFRLHLTNGVTFDVRHPEQASVSRDRITLAGSEPSSNSSTGAAPFRNIDVALLHITYIETIPVTPSPSVN
ncbi:MAG TPA: hypothetical protein VKA46_24550 [Gemmataceae bacterium]|nr:hypothetical protein [Gemmataceae bacterium]